MLRLKTIAGCLTIFVLGYGAGLFFGQNPSQIQATQQSGSGDGQFSSDVLQAYKKSSKAVQELNNLFVAGGQSTPVYSGMNYFGASVGGVDAVRDLEEGRGVDPETFAALYAELALPKIAEQLDYDELGRLRYKKNIIRIYSRERLKQMFQKRDTLEVNSASSR